MEELLTGSEFAKKVRGSGLTMGEVCEKAGIHQCAVSSWCNDKSRVYDDKVRKLIAAYNELTNKG